MRKNEVNAKYELVLIVDAKLSNDAKENVRKSVAESINKHGGKVINSQVWLEKHKIAFLIKKCREGTYYLINFEGPGEIVAKVRPDLKLNETILRFEFIKAESRTAAEPARV